MTSLWMLAALAAAGQGLAATTTTTTTSVWLPSRTTRAGDHIYASVITAVPEKSSTEYLLACTSVFRSPYPASCGDFRGVTLTQGPETMRIEFGSDTFTCDADEGDVCHLSDATAASSGEASFTAITVVSGADKLGRQKQTKSASAASPSATSDGEICKRATGSKGSSHGSGGGDGDSDGSSSPRPNGKGNGKGGDGCSGAGSLRAEAVVAMGVVGAVVGVVGLAV